jgi:P4 family phage/plasmid primase-like protien
MSLRFTEKEKQKVICSGSTIEELFKNIESIVASIPLENRYNIFYTIFNSESADSPRDFASQSVLPIDIDHVIDEHIELVVDVVCSAINLAKKDLIIVASGHGVQFLVKLPFHIEESRYFADFRSYYKNMADHIQRCIIANKLTGEVDTAVWSSSRLMRLPLTINRKEGFPDVEARLINRDLNEVPFDLTLFKPEVEDVRRINMRTTIQLEGVLQCPFLRWCNENQLDVSEPQWHAMIGVLSWLPEVGRDLAHKSSEQYPQYNPRQTDEYIDRALKLTGPRTCNSIAGCWNGCEVCSFRKDGKVNTPLVLKTNDYIKTQDSGFHFLLEGKDGKQKREPDFEGLVKFFKQEYNYIVHADSKEVYIWKEKDFFAFDTKYKGGVWYPINDIKIESYAYKHFKPFVKDTIRKEFKSLVLLNNHVASEFFDNVEGYINFNNGILDIKEGRLIEHSKEFGFKYRLDIDYDPSATCPTFDKFLSEVVCQDDAKILLEFIGVAAASEPNHRFEKALMLYGGGANGKSVLMNIIYHILGIDNCATVKMRDMVDPVGRYILNNKLVNIVSEENPKSLLNNTDIFKALVAGEAMSGKILYKGTFNFNPKTKQIYSFNELPITDDTSKGFFRRCLIIEFPNSFIGREDTLLTDKLKNESAGIWNAVIEAYKRVKTNNNKFTYSQSSVNQLNEFMEFSDNVNLFCNEFVLHEGVSLDNTVSVKDLYTLYSLETKNRNSYPVSEIRFVKRLIALLGKDRFTRRRNDQGARTHTILGVKIITGGSF